MWLVPTTAGMPYAQNSSLPCVYTQDVLNSNPSSVSVGTADLSWNEDRNHTLRAIVAITWIFWAAVNMLSSLSLCLKPLPWHPESDGYESDLVEVQLEYGDGRIGRGYRDGHDGGPYI